MVQSTTMSTHTGALNAPGSHFILHIDHRCICIDLYVINIGQSNNLVLEKHIAETETNSSFHRDNYTILQMCHHFRASVSEIKYIPLLPFLKFLGIKNVKFSQRTGKYKRTKEETCFGSPN